MLAVVGAVSGVASLAWNVISHFLTGGRLKVDLLGGWILEDGEPPLRVLVEPFAGKPALYMSIGERPHHAVLSIEATNKGRLPVTVKTWRLEFGEDAIGPCVPGHPDSSPLDVVLGPEESATWHHRLDEFLVSTQVASETGRSTLPIRGCVITARGRRVRSSPLPMRWDDLPGYFGVPLP